jgi:hypothetical protein
MRKKIVSLFVAIVFLVSSQVKADEGMWLPFLIQAKIGTMNQMGLKLTAEDIYSVNKPSIKDAIVTLDHGSCTAELVSGNGLIFTNHHCGYGEIQAHSTLEHDYLTNGFWANSYAEELPNPGKHATFLVRLEDVTDKVLAALNDNMSETERDQAAKQVSKKLEAEATKGTHYEARVQSFFERNHYYLFVYETFKDVRLVGAPPSSIGKYGGDTDNWEWPRHTGDFSIFRIYTGPDGKPAEYSENNIPLKAKYFLKISLKGVHEKDFTMVFGYPGSTDRYFTSWGVKNEMDNVNSIRALVRTEKLALMKEDMKADDKVRIQYASKYSRSANYWKYSIKQNQSLKANDVIGQKDAWQSAYLSWVNENSERKAKYEKTLDIIKNYYENSTNQEAEKVANIWFEAIFGGGEAIRYSASMRRVEGILKQAPTNMAALNDALKGIKESVADYFKDYNMPTDKKITLALLKMFNENVNKDYQLPLMSEMHTKYGSCDKFADAMFETSVFTDQSRMINFLELPNHDGFMAQVTKLAEIALEVKKAIQCKQDDKEIAAILKEKEQLFTSLSKNNFDGFNAEEAKTKFIEAAKNIYTDSQISEIFGASIENFANEVFTNSIFLNKAKLDKFLAKPKYKTLAADKFYAAMNKINKDTRLSILENDLVFKTMNSALTVYFKAQDVSGEASIELKKGLRLFLAGLLERAPANSIYPDANSTLRLTYGSVSGYEPADAVVYNYYTTIDGYMAKVNMEDDEFMTLPRMFDLYKAKDYGRYAEDGTLRTCFLSNNDITGGNSGSPVLNGNGHLIGIAFDGNSEAMSGDIIFEKELQKCINVDIRFVLWTIDKYAQNKHIMSELEIVQ